MRVVFICGILDHKEKDPIWNHLSAAFGSAYQCKTHVMRRWYLPGAVLSKRTFIHRIVAEHDVRDDVLLVGHSMGGVLACGVAARMQTARVLGVVTIFSPHLLAGNVFLNMVDGHVPEHVPVISFGATRDGLVWKQYTVHPRACAHLEINTDHQDELIHDPSIAHAIAQFTKLHIPGSS